MIDVTLIPILPHNDNYAYLLMGGNGAVAVVDPGDAAPIIEALEARNIEPDMILITHHHWDHVDGLPDMVARYDCPIIGAGHPQGKPHVAFDRILHEGDEFSFSGERVEIFETPGHCPEHLCFYFTESGFLLAGDTLFVMGCGRIIDGTPEELFASIQKLSALPDDIVVYCGHEYSLSNAKFCAHVAPNDAAIAARLSKISQARANNEPTVPTTIGAERETNVFMKVKSAAEFATLRKSKDNF